MGHLIGTSFDSKYWCSLEPIGFFFIPFSTGAQLYAWFVLQVYIIQYFDDSHM